MNKLKKLIMWAVAVAALLSVAGAVWQNHQNKKNQKEANEANLANQQAMWEQTNEYNDPTNQMTRLQKAGLNPNLIYGSGAPYNTAQNQNVPDVKTPEINNPLENLPSSMADYNNVRQQERRISNETLVATTNAANQAQDTANKKIQGAKTQFDLDQGRRMADNAYNLQELQLRSGIADAKNKEIENTQLPERHKKALMEANQRISLMGSQMTTEQKKQQMMDLDRQLKKMGLENAPWWSRWLYRNASEAYKPALDFGEYKNYPKLRYKQIKEQYFNN